MNYLIGIDVGTNSIGVGLISLNKMLEPNAIMRAAACIFSDGANPKDGKMPAVIRREARQARKMRDRHLKRQKKLMNALVECGFLPTSKEEQRKLVVLNPLEIRARGASKEITPFDFGRAVLHMEQRRGFQSNRKADVKQDDSGVMKDAIRGARQAIINGGFKTVGQWLYDRHTKGLTTRSKKKSVDTVNAKGKVVSKSKDAYALYIDRAMILDEFNTIWDVQKQLNPEVYTSEARRKIMSVLFFQRNLQAGDVGRCTLDPNEKRAPRALSSVQEARILQDLNHLRIEGEDGSSRPLTLAQRDAVFTQLNMKSRMTFREIKKTLGLPPSTKFSHESDLKRELKGNTTAEVLSRGTHLGEVWCSMTLEQQDALVEKLIESEGNSIEKIIDEGNFTPPLILWLQDKFPALDRERIDCIYGASLAEGYGMLGRGAINKILPKLKASVITYGEAVKAAGFDDHSQLDFSATGEILTKLPYYGEILKRHVAFPSQHKKHADPNELKHGRIANATVHIALNQLQKMLNEVVGKYGLPHGIIIETARDLGKTEEKKREIRREQASNAKRNDEIRSKVADWLSIHEDSVSRADVEKMKLWEELKDVNNGFALCPYSGTPITSGMLFSADVEVEHILPYSQTLDDTMSNKTLATRLANRVKGNRTPWQAKDDFHSNGWKYQDILERVKGLPPAKRNRFMPDAMEVWSKGEGSDFLARQLNDTRYIARLVREYVSVLCPQNTSVIPGTLTAMIRGKLGLNSILSKDGNKNRADHRHHAIDAIIVGVTNRGFLQKISAAAARAGGSGVRRLIDQMPVPFENFNAHVERAIENCIVHHKQDHAPDGALHDDSAIGSKDMQGKSGYVAIMPKNDNGRHKRAEDGSPMPYKFHRANGNYCAEIFVDEDGKWDMNVITTFEAVKIKQNSGLKQLRNKHKAQNGRPLVARLTINDMVKMEIDGVERIVRVKKMTGGANAGVFFASHNDAGVKPKLISKSSGEAMRKARMRVVTVSPMGQVTDRGFKG